MPVRIRGSYHESGVAHVTVVRQQNAMQTLDELLQSKYAHEIFRGVRKRIFQTKCGHLEPFESYSKRLSEGERIVILVYGFIAEVTNGGLEQFLSNSSGDYAEETRKVMHTIEATAAAAALDDVRAVIFAHSPIPTNRSERCDILFAWEEQDEDRFDAFYAKHDLGWCEPVELAVAIYIRAHREMFT